MDVVTLPRQSREFVRFGVTGFSDGEVADPTGLPVDAALMLGKAHPTEADWALVRWSSTSLTPVVEVLVGPEGDVSASVSGTHTLWCRIRGAMEQPARPIGPIKIT